MSLTAPGASEQAPPLRILITMCYLVHRTGAEMFTRDLALWMRSRGHSVAVFATAFGDMADELRQASIACITDVTDMTARPDVIIGNTHHETVRALLHFHDVPVLTLCHDRSADHGRPAQFSQVVRHAAVDENCAERLVHEFGIERQHIELLQNGIDLSRFAQRGPLPAKPRTALVFSNYASNDAQLEEVRIACTERGLVLDVIGSGSGNHLTDPATALGSYDIVFGKGRCATEALVTGNAVVALDPSAGMGEMITFAKAEQARRWNFGRAIMTRPITRQNVMAELDKFDAQDARAASDWARRHCGLDVMLSGLEQCVLRMAETRAVIPVPAEQRALELAHYMDDWIRRGNATGAHMEVAALRQHIGGLQQAFNAQQHAHQVQIGAWRAEVQRITDHATELTARLNETNSRLVDTERQHAAAFHAQLDETNARLADTERRARLEVADLHAQLSELAKLRAQLSEVYTSRSWRITAPLRRMSTSLQTGIQRK